MKLSRSLDSDRCTVESMRISPYTSAAMLMVAVCAHADCAERASMVSIRTVVIVILDSRRRKSTEGGNAKTLMIVVRVGCLTRRREPDASYHCGKVCW